MNKQALIDAISEKVGITKVQAEQIMDLLITSIVDSLKKNTEVSIAGLGIFSAKKRATRALERRSRFPLCAFQSSAQQRRSKIQ